MSDPLELRPTATRPEVEARRAERRRKAAEFAIPNQPPRPRMSVAPISPDVVSARVDIDHHVSKINNFLAMPWSDYDRTTGRYYAAGGMTAPEREAVIKAFAGAGWNVKFWGDQRDGDALVFHPRNVR